jgi:hypothetical protein
MAAIQASGGYRGYHELKTVKTIVVVSDTQRTKFF